MSNVVALIPARGGSTRLPRKALQLVGHQTLLTRAIDDALSSRRCDRIIVSSDDEEMLAEGAKHTEVEVRRRPPELATETATTMDVIVDLLLNCERHEILAGPKTAPHFEPDDILVLLQPTCPFRKGEDIAAGLDLLLQGGDSSISASEVAVPPQRAFRLDQETGTCLLDPTSELKAGRTRKQQYEPWYAPNGAIYAARAAHLLNVRNYFLGTVRAYIMPPERSIDVDSPLDLLFAQFLFEHLGKR